jgi:SRSO17 transposase
VHIVAPADETSGHQVLLVRRRIRDGDLAFYRCWSPKPVTVATSSVSPAPDGASRSASAGKDEAGLDQHQVRTWTSWYRYPSLAMLAHAVLAAIARANTPTVHNGHES